MKNSFVAGFSVPLVQRFRLVFFIFTKNNPNCHRILQRSLSSSSSSSTAANRRLNPTNNMRAAAAAAGGTGGGGTTVFQWLALLGFAVCVGLFTDNCPDNNSGQLSDNYGQIGTIWRPFFQNVVHFFQNYLPFFQNLVHYFQNFGCYFLYFDRFF